ncbi:MAG: hypothetical protein RJB22_1114 [Pseudomonadota bacterium]|jgi:hypothetical protein
MTHICSGKFFTKQLAYAAGYTSPKRFTTDVLRYDLPIHPCGPESYRDNLYDLPNLLKSIILGRLKEVGLPMAKSRPILDLINDHDANQAAFLFLISKKKCLFCVVNYGGKPQASWQTSNLPELFEASAGLILDVGQELLRMRAAG